MPAGKDHYRERGADREWGERTGAVADDRAPDSQNQEKRPDEFSKVFVHDLPSFDVSTKARRSSPSLEGSLLSPARLLCGYKFVLPYGNAERFRDASPIVRISSSAVRNMPLQDLLRGAPDRAGRVAEEQLLLLSAHLPEEIARLLPVIIH
jgi:hypothetical protein